MSVGCVGEGLETGSWWKSREGMCEMKVVRRDAVEQSSATHCVTPSPCDQATYLGRTMWAFAHQLKGGWDQSRSGWRTTLLRKKNVFRTFKKCDFNQISSVIFCNHEQTCICLWLQLILKVLAGSPQI